MFSCTNSIATYKLSMLKITERGIIMDYERLLKEFLLELKLQNYSKRTIETYQLHHKKFLTFYKKEFGSPIIISNVLKIHYKMFIGELLDLELKTTYINAILKSHKTFWSYLLREQVVEENPLETIKLLKEDRKVLTINPRK